MRSDFLDVAGSCFGVSYHENPFQQTNRQASISPAKTYGPANRQTTVRHALVFKTISLGALGISRHHKRAKTGAPADVGAGVTSPAPISVKLA